VRRWKDRYGSEPELFFAQEQRAGERLEIDWLDCGELGVRIGGEAFCHKLVHMVLPFSNWEWAAGVPQRVVFVAQDRAAKCGLGAWRSSADLSERQQLEGDARAWARTAGPGV